MWLWPSQCLCSVSCWEYSPRVSLPTGTHLLNENNYKFIWILSLIASNKYFFVKWSTFLKQTRKNIFISLDTCSFDLAFLDYFEHLLTIVGVHFQIRTSKDVFLHFNFFVDFWLFHRILVVHRSLHLLEVLCRSHKRHCLSYRIHLL